MVAGGDVGACEVGGVADCRRCCLSHHWNQRTGVCEFGPLMLGNAVAAPFVGSCCNRQGPDQVPDFLGESQREGRLAIVVGMTSHHQKTPGPDWVDCSLLGVGSAAHPMGQQ